MQYRNVAKAFIFDKGARQEMVAEDGVVYGEGKALAPGKLEKANKARKDIADKLAKKWGLDVE